jgi:hypothetical protein
VAVLREVLAAVEPAVEGDLLEAALHASRRFALHARDGVLRLDPVDAAEDGSDRPLGLGEPDEFDPASDIPFEGERCVPDDALQPDAHRIADGRGVDKNIPIHQLPRFRMMERDPRPCIET